MANETHNCRGCGKPLTGTGTGLGGSAVYDPKSKVYAKWNWYGGWVCSEVCDVRACLELEQSMPGHGMSQKTIGQDARQSVNRNWNN